MIKQDITFEDFDGNTVTETHYFHLSKTELIEMDLGTDGGLDKKLTTIVASGNGAEILRTFREIVASAYGERVPGSGTEFFKKKEVTDRFMGGLAFDALLMKLATDAGFAAEFVSGIIPKDLAQAANVQAAFQEVKNVGATQPAEYQVSEETTGLKNPFDPNGDPLPWALREPTQNEMMAMNAVQMQDVYRRKSLGWAPPSPARL